MMKKFLTVLLAMLMIASSIFPSCASNTEAEVEYMDDGSYIVTVINEVPVGISLMSTTVTKSKTATHYSVDGTAIWFVKVTGTFTYGNGNATCTSASVTAKSYSSRWTITSKSASRSGNRATGTATAYCSSSGGTYTKTVTLTCSSTGTFS